MAGGRVVWLRRGFTGLVAIYALVIVLLAGVLHGLTDVWAPATLIAFAPRWVYALPLIALVPICLIWHRRILVWLVITAAIWWLAIMDYQWPWQFSQPEVTFGVRVRVVSFNIGNGTDLEAFDTYLKQVRPDVVMLQECPRSHPIIRLFDPQQWEFEHDRTATFSRLPLRRLDLRKTIKDPKHRGLSIGSFRVITSEGPLYFFNVHLPTPRSGLAEILHTGWDGLDDLRRVNEKRRQQSKLVRDLVGRVDGHQVVAGDFNMTCESRVFQRVWDGFQNAFEVAGTGLGRTKYTRWHGVRIDHILVSDGPWHVTACEVGPDLGGDHRPVAAILQRKVL